MKSEIIQELGQVALLLPARIAEGLAANDRVKVRLSALQAALGHSRNPQGMRFALTEECRAAGIDPLPIEILVNRASTSAGGRIAAPGLGALRAAIVDDVTIMARAVKAGDADAGEAALARLSALEQAIPPAGGDEVELAQITGLIAISSTDGDSLHRLVMDLHRALNELSTRHAAEEIAGAHAYGLRPDDRVAVGAFMRGIAATEKLRFGHPGLATTAARAGERFTIQNDIGETDAHVVVIAVGAEAVTVTYTDVHLPRAKFFADLFKDFAVEWSGIERKSAAGLADDGAFHLITGRYSLGGGNNRDVFLEALGASLVFLIDWNKARKALRTCVGKNDAVVILHWAAQHRFGHRGFLELGGGEFVSAAVRHAASNRIGFGEELDRVLGRDAALDFLKGVLRVAAEALLQGSSVRQARDRVEADLVRHLQRTDTTLLAVVLRQAGLARDLGAELAQFIDKPGIRRRTDGLALAKTARHIEEKADRIAMEARGEIARLNANRGIAQMVNRMEDTIDELEQAAFVASLLPSELAPELTAALTDLCAAVVCGAEAAATGAAAAAEVPEGHRVDSEEALAAAGRLAETEHRADTAERRATELILTGASDLKVALSVMELARALERATDRLAGFGHALREHVLADLTP